MRPRDESKIQAIHAKTVELAAQEGFDRLSMHKLAKAVGISPGTLYIYFRDREDLILQVSIAAQRQLFKATLQDFDPEMPFADGLRTQWRNRARYFLENPSQMQFLEMIRYSRFEPEVTRQVSREFADSMRSFTRNAIERGELVELPLEVYWSIAYAPLYQLVKFHVNGKGMLGRPFTLTRSTIDQSANIILRALAP